MEKFLIIDGNSIMNRAFYGLSPRTSMMASGIHTNALFGFLNIYWMIENMINPDYTVVTFDVHAKTFRHKMYDEYKGTRKSMPDELRPQMVIIKDILRALNIPIIEKEGFEADDILGTVAKINEKNNIFTYILTGDKDSFQLISDKTSIVIPTTRMGKTEYTTYTPELLKEKFNIDPYQVVDVKSLMGDSSDNIPGVKGIGEKTAYTLINKYTTLDNIYTNIDSLDASAKIIEKLKVDKENAYLSYTLAKIDTTVDIDLDYDKSKLSDPNTKDLYTLFKRLKFNKFIEKFDLASLEIDDINEELLNAEVYNNMDTTNISNEKTEDEIKLENILTKYNQFKTKNKDVCYVDDVQVLNNLLNTVNVSYCLNIHDRKHYINNLKDISSSFLAFTYESIDKIYVIKLDSLIDILSNSNDRYSNISDMLEYKLLETFTSSNVVKLGMNIKQDLRLFFDIGMSNIINFKFDPIIAKHLLDSNISNHTITTLLQDELNILLDNNLNIKTQVSMFDEVIDEEVKYITDNEQDIINIYINSIYPLYEILEAKLKVQNMDILFNTIEMPLAETLASMESVGMYIDIDKLNEFDIMLKESIFSLEQDIYTLAKEEFNINSPKQLGDILFSEDKLALPTSKKTKTGYSTNKEVLEALEDKHEIIPKLLEYRTLAKLKSTYVDGLRDKIESDGKIHTTFMQTVTSTGRLSSTEPNLQNIPIRLELGRKIRTFFTASSNNTILLDSDYSQIELRVLAHMANDSSMINAFLSNEDIHKVTASQVFDKPLDEVTSDLRSKAKAVNFGIVYGISSFGLAKNINVSAKEAKEYIDSYLTKYISIKEFMDIVVKDATKDGYVTTIYNRRRYIPELSNSNKMIQNLGKRLAMNTPVQGSAADIIKIAMNNIYFKLKTLKLKSKLIMQVHDELIIECHNDEIDLVKNILKEEMENASILKVPLIADVNKGFTWYDAK